MIIQITTDRIWIINIKGFSSIYRGMSLSPSISNTLYLNNPVLIMFFFSSVTQSGRLQKPTIVMLLINDPKKAVTCERNTKLKPIIISQKNKAVDRRNRSRIFQSPITFKRLWKILLLAPTINYYYCNGVVNVVSTT